MSETTPLGRLIQSAPPLSRPAMAEARLAEWMASLVVCGTDFDGISDASKGSDVSAAGPQYERGGALGEHPRLLAWCQTPPIAALLAALVDHSPYLWRLVTQGPGRLETLLDAPPQQSLGACLTGLAAETRSAATTADAMAALRRAKALAHLLVALADLGGVWDLEEVVDALTGFADAAVAAALDFLLRDAEAAGKITAGQDGSAKGCGIVVLALGKGGGRELNYSSDIDLVVLYDPKAPRLAPALAPAPFFVRMTQNFVRLLAERTAEGYVLRVDLRLRPDPASTTVALSLAAAFTYYETLGQNWERAAFIKARPIAGDLALGARFLAELAPFIWRKYFDYAAIADIHAMKRQIHAVRGFADVTVAGHDVKLGRGGIREVEFFVQTQQLIFGGRRPRLRGAATLAMLAELCADGWIGPDAVTALSAAYRFLRRIEHRLQMVSDAQTQRLPDDPAGLRAFAAFAGYAAFEAFETDLLGHMRAVEAHYARLFEHAPGLDVAAGSLVFAGEALDPETVETLARLGFSRPRDAVETIRGWHFGRRAAVQSARAREVLTELVPALLTAFAGSGDPDAALVHFDAMLARMPAAVELLTILKANAALRELFADILGLAPRLAAAVALRPHLLDGAIDPAHLAPNPDALAVRFAGLPAGLAIEDALDRLRDIAGEAMFLIGTRLLSGAEAPEAAGRHYADLADHVIAAALREVAARFAEQHGEVPGGRAVVLAMGKLGSREMTAASDLDLMVIYDFAAEAGDSCGPRPLDAPRYYTRLTQRLIAALTVATRRGRLYEVDMRLRPSGRQGPLATQFRSFLRYQAEEAALWEHMALTRARVVAGDQNLAAEVAAAIRACLTQPRPGPIGPAVLDLRALVAHEKGEADSWNLKQAAGGQLDIEFLAQALVLRHAALHPELLGGPTIASLGTAVRLGLVPSEAGETLLAACRLYTNVTQMMRLTLEGRFEPARAGPGLRRRLIAVADLPDFATLERELGAARQAVRHIFREVLAGL